MCRQESSVCAGRRAPEIELIEAEELGSSLVIHLNILWNSDASATVSLFTATCLANVFQSPQITRTQILGLIPLSQIRNRLTPQKAEYLTTRFGDFLVW